MVPARASRQKKNFKSDVCFFFFPSLFSSVINTLLGCLVKVKQGEILLAGKSAELSFGCRLSLFFRIRTLMNETHRIATKETLKNGHQKSSSVPIYLLLQWSAATAPSLCCFL